MTKRMLIDATHAEETRVVVLDGNRLEDFDVETSTKRQLKGNIYLAKVVRVEPSLQAAFVEYGGNRHGFLAFSEIHPDYYQIPVADRQRLIDQEVEEARLEEEAVDRELAQGGPEPAEARHQHVSEPEQPDEPGEAAQEALYADPAHGEPDHTEHAPTEHAAIEHAPTGPDHAEAAHIDIAPGETPDDAPEGPGSEASHPAAQPLRIESETLSGPVDPAAEATAESHAAEPHQPGEPGETHATEPDSHEASTPQFSAPEAHSPEAAPVDTAADDEADAQPYVPPAESSYGTDHSDYGDPSDGIPESPPPETVGGEADVSEEPRERRFPSRHLRNYKIQEVIKRRQILLIQVVKEERGTKGAALTTYLSLAGRFSVLMPNSPRGGGISRKITSAADRRRLKEIMNELAIPKGMGIIVRTAGAARPKAEIKRDCEYLLRLWDDIREHTLKSVAPAQIYEEASLIKRAIRDVYSRDIDEIQVDGEDGWRAAHEFMRMLMPSHAKKVQLWRDPAQPLFARHQVETQLDGMLQPTVQLRSGGYLVINQAEALVAIDVNSGRSTRERGIEETALRTNLEAADEVARQLRLRDLAGLIVIDFIDMEAKKHNAMVERRIKEALKNDRARIQVGHISHFGLLEMSRQRLRPSLAETSFIACSHCGGTGHVRSTESAAIHVLRGIEEEGGKRRAAEIVVYVATPIALYILNHKRERLAEIEARYAMRVTITGDDTQIEPQFRIDRLRPQTLKDLPTAITPDALPAPLYAMADAEPDEEDDVIVADDDEADEDEAGEAVGEAAQARDAQARSAQARSAQARSAQARTAQGGDAQGGDAQAGDAQAGDAHAEDAHAEDAGARPGETAAESTERRRRRRRRRRGGRPEDGRSAEPPIISALPEAEPPISASETDELSLDTHIEGVPEHTDPAGEDDGRGAPGARLRRGRRGGRRRGRREDGEASPFAAPGTDQPDMPPVYTGPTPADPFAGHAFDIFDVLEQAEVSAAARSDAMPAIIESAPEPALAAVTAEPEIMNASAPEPSNSEPMGAEEVAEPAVAASSEHGAMPEMTNTGALEPAQSETVAPEPAVKPIMVVDGEEPSEKKRGWWRK